MNNLMQRLKNLPWRWLLQSAAITIVFVVILEITLTLAAIQFPMFRRALGMLFGGPLGILMSVAVAVGTGALSVYLLEIWQQRFLLNASTLWALVGCLLLALFVKSNLPVPSFLLDLSRFGFIGVMLGVFWKGRPYWR